ncbi:cysteine-rich receptor-like protein kinase 25 [Miscanthus floridulus]|uniref:cysteine-rich receptor-like protein kinase 25 n=1 Tax=Miscanthus floridulus TaxID=154761 RepID=UPI00345AF6D6
MEFHLLESIIGGNKSPSHLKLPFLQFITKKISEELKIGNSGCGVVYKGIQRNQIIAVKRLLNSHTIEDKMFHREVKSMIMVSHKNVVRFLGYCSHTEERALFRMEGKRIIMAQDRERLLCFEYLINGSLQSYLTDELRGLEWQTRYKIIKGICDGLHYLHGENHIVHMDLKPANIQLDSNMVPKITDFGLSRLDSISQTMSSERLVSLGYCAPEYLHHGKMSTKSDIYSLGVIILVLVTGSKEEPNITKLIFLQKIQVINATHLQLLMLFCKLHEPGVGAAVYIVRDM